MHKRKHDRFVWDVVYDPEGEWYPSASVFPYVFASKKLALKEKKPFKGVEPSIEKAKVVKIPIKGYKKLH